MEIDIDKGAAGGPGGGVPKPGADPVPQPGEPDAGAGAGNEPQPSGGSGGDNGGGNVPNRGFTQADIDRAVEEAKKQWAAEQDEADRLSKLSKDEREREKLRIDREKFDKERAAFAREKLEAETARQLAERRLPASMAARICGKDAEETKANIDAFEAEWNEALKTAVNERLRSTPPRVPGSRQGGGSSMKDIIEASVKKGF